MKYILFGLLFMLMGCSDSDTPKNTINTGLYSYTTTDYNISGMHYKAFTLYGDAIYVVNVTKDSLEVLKLTK